MQLGWGQGNNPKSLLPAAAINKKVKCSVCIYSAKELDRKILIVGVFIFLGGLGVGVGWVEHYLRFFLYSRLLKSYINFQTDFAIICEI